MNIIEAIRDPKLFGGLPHFKDLTSWAAWIVALKVLYGLELEAGELEVFRACTGRQHPRDGGSPEACFVTAVQSGKTSVAGIVGAYEALHGEHGTHAVLVGQGLRSALNVLTRSVRQPFESIPAFEGEVVNRTAEALELRNGVSVSTFPCKPEAVRGVRANVCILDELAFYITSEGRPTDREMLRVARGRLATTRGKLIVISSPYAQAGALWDLHRQHYGREESPVLVWQADALTMNPTLSLDYIARIEQDDPEAAVSEIQGQFRAGLSSLLDGAALDAVTVTGRREIPPTQGVSYRAFTDPSGGKHDSWTLAIGHRTKDGKVIVDCLRRWPSPFSPPSVAEEAAGVLKSYGLSRVTGDAYGGSWPGEALRAHGVEYVLSEVDRSGLYLGLVPAVNGGALELPDDATLSRELRMLQRTRGPSGKDRVDHPRNGSDDSANSVAGVVSLLQQKAVVLTAIPSQILKPTHERSELWGTWEPTSGRGGLWD